MKIFFGLKATGLKKAVGFWVLCFTLGACQLVEDREPEISEAHYQIYRGDGTLSSLGMIVSAMEDTAVTFLGEGHNDPVAHHLELVLLREAVNPGMALSLEMFESDVQYVLDEYLAGSIREDHLLASARAWDNYENDYRPLVEYAKQQDLPVIAANAPRRYVNMVSRLGEESLMDLSPQAKQYLPPLPYAEANPRYAEKFLQLMKANQRAAMEVGEEAVSEAVVAEQEAELTRSLRAQSLWDASMAYSIAQFLNDNSGSKVLHLNGSFHSAQRMGIPDHLNIYRPDTGILVVTMIASEGFPEFDPEQMKGLGDFVVVTDASLPRSY